METKWTYNFLYLVLNSSESRLYFCFVAKISALTVLCCNYPHPLPTVICLGSLRLWPLGYIAMYLYPVYSSFTYIFTYISDSVPQSYGLKGIVIELQFLALWLWILGWSVFHLMCLGSLRVWPVGYIICKLSPFYSRLNVIVTYISASGPKSWGVRV